MSKKPTAAAKAPKRPARKKPTPKQKAEAKEARAQAGSDPADRSPSVGDNLARFTDDQRRALFLNHVVILDAAEKGVAKAKKRLAEAKKIIEQEGGSVKRTQLGIKLRATEEKSAERVRAEEVKVRREIEETMTVARWVGSDLGKGQLDWLEGMTPASDRAFDEGKMTGLMAGPRKPPYDPSVPQYKRWMEGFDEGQAVLKTKLGDAVRKGVEPEKVEKGAAGLLFEEPKEPEKEPAKATPAPKPAQSKGEKAAAAASQASAAVISGAKKAAGGTQAASSPGKRTSAAPPVKSPAQEPPAQDEIETDPKAPVAAQEGAPPEPPEETDLTERTLN